MCQSQYLFAERSQFSKLISVNLAISSRHSLYLERHTSSDNCNACICKCQIQYQLQLTNTIDISDYWKFYGVKLSRGSAQINLLNWYLQYNKTKTGDTIYKYLKLRWRPDTSFSILPAICKIHDNFLFNTRVKTKTKALYTTVIQHYYESSKEIVDKCKSQGLLSSNMVMQCEHWNFLSVGSKQAFITSIEDVNGKTVKVDAPPSFSPCSDLSILHKPSTSCSR